MTKDNFSEAVRMVREASIYWIDGTAAGHELANDILESLPSDDALQPAWRDVLAERQRQISAEGWTPRNDDAYQSGDLANAAACYAQTRPVMDNDRAAPADWPWAASWWKPTDRRRDLVKAGALILAEIERLDRASLAKDAK